MPDYAGKSLRFASKGCHSSPGLKPWGFLACFIKLIYGVIHYEPSDAQRDPKSERTKTSAFPQNNDSKFIGLIDVYFVEFLT
jgi:hypothetical protein